MDILILYIYVVSFPIILKCKKIKIIFKGLNMILQAQFRFILIIHTHARMKQKCVFVTLGSIRPSVLPVLHRQK